MIKSPGDMHASERIEEISLILAEDVLRLKQKIAKKRRWMREVSLDSSGYQSAHANCHEQEEAA